MNLLRPSATSHRHPSDTTTRLSASYNREAQAEQTRRRELASTIHSIIINGDTDTTVLQAFLHDNPSAASARDQGHEGGTPLHTAARLGRTAALDLLLSLRKEAVDIDAVDSRKRTALHSAAKYGSTECVEQLLKAGADTKNADDGGHLARWYALNFKGPEGERMRELFDSPPRVVKRGRGKKRKGKEKRKSTKMEHESSSGSSLVGAGNEEDGPTVAIRSVPVPGPGGIGGGSTVISPVSSPHPAPPPPPPALWKHYAPGSASPLQKTPEHSIPEVIEVFSVASVGTKQAKTHNIAREEEDEEDSDGSEDSEDEDPAKTAPPPQGMEKTLCEAFRGSFWEPDGERGWNKESVWDLVYDNSDEAVRRRGSATKWFHLSATCDRWAKDLARNICAQRQWCTGERSEEVCDFMARVFESVDNEGPVRKHHFMREGSSDKKLLDEDEMYAVVLPIIDVDKQDYLQLARANQSKEVLQMAYTEELLELNSFDRYRDDPVVGPHLKTMMQLSDFFEHPLPRSLDQSYHEHLDHHKITTLDGDQVLTRYLGRLKKKSSEIVKKSSQTRPAILGSNPSTKGSIDKDNRQVHITRGRSSDSPARETSSDRESVEKHESEPNDLITVPHFWLFKLDSDTIITLYPERWDKMNESNLQDHVLKCVSNNHGTDNDETDKDESDSDDSASSKGPRFIDEVADTILKSCLSFEAKAFAKCANPRVPGGYCDEEITFGKAYANSIAEMYTELAEQFRHLKEGLGSLIKDSNDFYRHVKEETKILIRADDNIAEINMIKRILWNQARTINMFRRSVPGQWTTAGGGEELNSPALEVFEQLETEAQRVRAMAVTILDLRQREAAIEDILNQGEQNTMLFIFTAVTVLFSPLSLVCGILAMPVAGFPAAWDASPLAKVFGFATLATAGLCLLMWALYKIYQAFEVRQRNKERSRQTTSAFIIPTTGMAPLLGSTTAGNKAEQQSGGGGWMFGGLQRSRAGGLGMRFRGGSRRKEEEEEEEQFGEGIIPGDGIGRAAGSSMGHRELDVEKGV